ncbi:unnamed protein product [Umbelopsis ramanniana]
MSSDLITKYTTNKGYKLQCEFLCIIFNLLVQWTEAFLAVQTGLFINNEFVPGSSQIEIVNPTNGKAIVKVEAADKREVDAAVSAAHQRNLLEQAYKSWSKTAPSYRRDLMLRFADLIDRDKEEIAQIETLNAGKAITWSRALDASFLSECLRYFGGWADKLQGKLIETDGVLTMTRHEPIGVCGAIVPWNFPALLLVTKLAPAIATGNTIVAKSSEITPLSSLKLAALAKEAGFPPGVINIITGYGHTTGELLSRHNTVRKITFTGSTRAGRLVMKAAAESNMKKVTLELGGKSPNIIFGDVDIEKAVKWAFRGIYFHQAIQGIYFSFSIGNPTEDSTFHGPQVSKTQYDRIMEYIESGKKEGATVTLGGERWGNEGYYIQPTIFTDVTEDMRIMKEEIFGPVVCVSKFKDLDEAVELANNTNYGLAAAVFSQNIDTCLSVAEQIQSGVVWVNCINVFDTVTPLGGYKESGFGREGGEYVLAEYTQVKAVKINKSITV